MRKVIQNEIYKRTAQNVFACVKRDAPCVPLSIKQGIIFKDGKIEVGYDVWRKIYTDNDYPSYDIEYFPSKEKFLEDYRILTRKEYNIKTDTGCPREDFK